MNATDDVVWINSSDEELKRKNKKPEVIHKLTDKEGNPKIAKVGAITFRIKFLFC